MRSIYYIATVINNYRRAIDEYYNGTLTKEKIKKYLKELNKVAARDSCDQFFNQLPTTKEQYFLGRSEISNQDFLAIVASYKDGYVNVISKNYFKPGDIVEIISPHNEPISFVIPDIYDMDGNKLDASRHPEEMVKFKLDVEVSKYDMIRIKLA